MATQAAAIKEMLARRGIAVDEAKLRAPDVGTLVGRVEDEFEWMGDDYMPEEAEYARAAGMTPDLRDLAIQNYQAQGFVAAPGIKARMKGCHTEGEVIMIRSRDVGDAHRAAEEQRMRQRRGEKTTSESLGSQPMDRRTATVKQRDLAIQPPQRRGA